ncbi:fec operon regulator FecR [compost metagenome]
MHQRCLTVNKREMEGKLNQLFENYLNNQCSDQEILNLLEYFKIEQEEPVLRELIMQELQRSGEPNIRVDRVEERLNLAYAGIREYIIQEEAPVIRKIKLWKRIAVAAAIATIVFGGGLYYYNLNLRKVQLNETAYKNDAGPGKTGATLTLANGQKIRLSDEKNGELAKDAGVTINKSANGQLVYDIVSDKSAAGHINTLSTTNGETYKVRLPDGTQIWLNAASKLIYTTNLIRNGKRVVQLDGEAYFEVSKDKKHPFVVESKGQFVEVLGTHFNINAYRDEPQIATTLLEGSVKVGINGKTQLIRPGQQAVNYGGRLKVNDVSLDDITDWKEGDFFLNHVDFKTAMRKIARWYDVEIVYDVAVPEDLESGGWMSRRNKLSTVLKAIEDTGLARFRIEGKTVHVFK